MSTMFEKKPPRVEAMQWDGTPEGAAQLKSFMAAASGVSLGFVMTTNFNDGGKAYPYITFTSRDLDRMWKGAWLVFDVTGRPDVLPDEIFKRDYAEVAED